MVPQNSTTDDIDKLLEIANTPKKVTNPEIDKFISESKIVSGSKRIPAYIIYYRYAQWKKTELLTKRKFFNYFKLKFEQGRTDDGIGYLLNPKGFNLTPQGFFKARAFLRKQNDKDKHTTK